MLVAEDEHLGGAEDLTKALGRRVVDVAIQIDPDDLGTEDRTGLQDLIGRSANGSHLGLLLDVHGSPHSASGPFGQRGHRAGGDRAVLRPAAHDAVDGLRPVDRVGSADRHAGPARRRRRRRPVPHRHPAPVGPAPRDPSRMCGRRLVVGSSVPAPPNTRPAVRRSRTALARRPGPPSHRRAPRSRRAERRSRHQRVR